MLKTTKLAKEIVYDLAACCHEDCDECKAYMHPAGGDPDDYICLGLIIMQHNDCLKAKIQALLEQT